MSFTKKSLKQSPDIASNTSLKGYFFQWKFFLIMAIVAIGGFFGGYIWQGAKGFAKEATLGIVKVASQTLGTSLQEDTRGNINVLLAGYAGKDAMGGLLTDSMMMVSYSPKLNAATFLSVPRDLYVSYGTGSGAGRLNGLLWHYHRNSTGTDDQNLDLGAKKLMTKIGDITGLEPHYYALVDFDGFVSLIDSIGGIQVDVPEKLYDTEFPDDNYKGYITLDIPAGQQYMSGKTALRYARSRHSTSDFSRSARQQIIMKAVIDGLIDQVQISKITTVRGVFDMLTKIIRTNATLDEIITLVPKVDTKRHIFSFVYSAECSSVYLETVQPGCLLYNGDRRDFGGAATLLPLGATPSKLSNYALTQDFGRYMSEHQDMLIEKASLTIVNSIDPLFAKQIRYPHSGVAGSLAIDLKKKGFQITDIQGSKMVQTGTTLYIQQPEKYPATIALFKDILPFALIDTGANIYPDMTLMLGDEYLSFLSSQPKKK